MTAPQDFPPLELVTSPTVPTEQAGYYLNRRPQTMREWAMRENGPLRPIRINGRLAWPVSELRRICGVGDMTDRKEKGRVAPHDKAFSRTHNNAEIIASLQEKANDLIAALARDGHSVEAFPGGCYVIVVCGSDLTQKPSLRPGKRPDRGAA